MVSSTVSKHKQEKMSANSETKQLTSFHVLLLLEQNLNLQNRNHHVVLCADGSDWLGFIGYCIFHSNSADPVGYAARAASDKSDDVAAQLATSSR
jgi:hypothetical protein